MRNSEKTKNYVFRKGDIAYFPQEGQLVEILDFYKKEGLFGGTVVKIGCLKDLNHKNSRYKVHYEVRPWSLYPVKDEEAKLILKMTYKSTRLGSLRLP